MNYKILSSIIVTLLFCLVFQNSAIAQEEKESEGRHFISVTFAQTYIPKGTNQDNLNHKGHFVPGIGFDYLYKIKPRFELGVMADIELGRYIIPHKEDLERDHALVLVGVATYTLLPSWNAFVGGGIELERHHNLGVLRMGTEYNFAIGNNWSIPVGIFYDLKEGYDSWSISVGLGRSF
ncbi:hypothetical protein KMW28_07625 [Flammeovirga yaeyamensis]|uniref:Outer membrane protein beta-barrel domain-containing protein n=1 Tax=Flammeovirga yaeyamensis TaxID=367791 RepID=A0AAX1N7J5_9BACT|nr:hypothetical protein [Flammeovirga yaeyamensis]MBB3698051.1 hypothetical protein [Flammeovirga yaeyamensis]NMF35597.1 hypothetical protein [Flammeovirga yaeyamensis]QWG03445.1 hypothetical protein KMW28_07625 [Flammeovirga yaeyamensis]